MTRFIATLRASIQSEVTEMCAMTGKTKDRLIIIACAIGSLLAAADIVVAVIDLVLINLGKQTILF
jgi:hypothetical protein